MNMFRIICMCRDIIDFVKDDYFETENILIKKRNSTVFDISLIVRDRIFRVIENNVLVIQGDYSEQLEEYLESIVKLFNIKSEPFTLKPMDVALSKLKKVSDELFLEIKMKYILPKDTSFSCVYLIPVKTNETYYDGYKYEGENCYLICGTTFRMYYIDTKENKIIRYRLYSEAKIFKIIERGYL